MDRVGALRRTIEDLVTNKPSQVISNVIISVIYLICFFTVDLLTHQLIGHQADLSPWRPATGLAFASGLLFSPIFGIVIFLGDFISQVFIFHQVLSLTLLASSIAFAIFIGLLPAFVIRFFKINVGIQSIRDLFYTAGIAMVVTIITGVIAINYHFVISGFPPENPIQNFVFHWLYDLLGIISVSFLILILRDWLRVKEKKANGIRPIINRLSGLLLKAGYSRLIELIVLIVIVILVVLVFDEWITLQFLNPYFLVIIPMIWLAIRFGKVGSVIGVFILSLLYMISAEIDRKDLIQVADLQYFNLVIMSATIICGVFISERNRINQKLIQSEEIFKTVALSAPVGILKIDLDAIILYANEYFLKLAAKQEAEIRHISLVSLIHPEDQQNLTSNLEQSQVNGKEFTQSLRLDQRLGKYKWIQATFSPQIDLNSNVHNFLVTCTDISHLKEHEEMISNSERTLTAFLDNLPDPAWLKDKNGKYLAVNREMEVLHRKDRSEFIGKDDLEVWGEKEGPLFQKTDRIVIESGKPMRFESRLHPDDEIHWYETVKTALIIDGEIYGTTGIARDISDRRLTELALKESESQLKGLLNNIPDMAWMKDRDKRILAVNNTFLKAFHLNEADVVGKNNTDIFPPEIAAAFDRDDDEVMSIGRPKVIEESIPNDEGYLSWYETIKMPLFNDQQEIVGTTGIAREITSRKRSDESLRHRLLTEKTVGEISSELMSIEPENASQTIQRILEKIAAITEADRCSLLLLKRNGGTTNSLYQYTAPGLEHREIKYSNQHSQYQWLSDTMRSKNIICCKRVSELPSTAIAEIEHWLEEGIVSLMYVPIGSSPDQIDALIGLETVEHEKNWLEDDQQLLQIAGEMITTALSKLESESKMRAAEAKYRMMVEQISAIVYIDNVDAISSGVFMSPQIKTITGYSPEEILSDPSLFWRIIHPDDRDRVLDLNNLTNRTGEPFSAEYRIVCRDGRVIWVQDYAVLFKGENGVSQWHGFIFDITHRKKIENELSISQSRYHELFENSPISLWEEDFSKLKKRIDQLKRQGVGNFKDYLLSHPKEVKNLIGLIQVIDVNQTALSLTGYADKHTLINNFANLRMVLPDGLFIDEMEHIANGRTQFEVEGPNDIVDGKMIYHNLRFIAMPGYEDSLERVIVAVSDITERKVAEEQLIYLSTHDSLTGLFSRSYFETELERLQGGRQYPISILMADADRLKETNDREGHAAGDKLIKRAAQVLKLTFRPEDVVARIGGDEFAVLIPKTDEESAIKLHDRLLSMIEQENKAHPELTPLGLSVGVATAENGMSLAELLRIADKKMYSHKDSKRASMLADESAVQSKPKRTRKTK